MPAPQTDQAMNASWESVGALSPASLIGARLQLHHAAQIVNSAAISFLPAAADDSHTNLEWLDDARVLASHLIPAPSPFHVGLSPEDFSILIMNPNGSREAAFNLRGQSLHDAVGWLRDEVGQHGQDGALLTQEKHYTIPDHPVAHGAAFDADAASLTECAHYWHDAAAMLRAIASSTDGSSSVRCWPHHFDLATLVTLPDSRSIGTGMSLGDDSYAEPYFYVGPYPRPDTSALAPLPSGHWHTEGWTGAVLTASELTSVTGTAGHQHAIVHEFIQSATAISRKALLG